MTNRKTITTLRDKNQTKKSRSRGRNRRLLLEQLEDRRLLATYALQSEVFAQTAPGGPLTGATGDGFGCFVTLSDDGGVVIVGAPEADGGKGAAYAYQRNDNGTPADQTDDSWGFFASISAPDGAAGDNFGASIAVSEAMLVIGAPGVDVAATDQGAVYVFDTQNGFAMTKLTLSSPQTGDRFGATVAATNSGTRIAAGAPLFDGPGADRGGVFVFENSGAGWSAPVALTAPVSEDGAQFGAAVALDGNSAVVGAPLEDSGGADRGSAYLFTYDPDTTTWSAGTPLVPGASVTLNAGDRYGAAVEVDQGFIVVGSPGAPGTGVGGAHVFADMGGGLGHVYSPDVGPSGLNLPGGANYGAAVAAVGGAQPRAAVGAPGIDAGGGANQGGVHVFGMGMADEFFAGSPAGDRFGSALAMLGNTLVVGAPLRDNGATVDTGGVAIYGPTTPPQPMDFGDAKSSYGTRLNDDGPRHVVGALYLGASIDAEMDATETWDASGDDFTGIDDEDGVTLPGGASFDGALLVIGDTATVDVTLSQPGRIDAWLDLNA
ncbi:MAG TPA: hypothetical protein PLF81_27260, partial [Candidatus Anammoximicrobium sp.]|nr:hypothetical protein [Candidatus Anammoximicrobium sp.]